MRSPSTPISLAIAPVQPEPAKMHARCRRRRRPPSRMIRAGVLAQPRGLQAGAAGLGVGVGVARQHLVADEVLDERQRPARRGVVGVGDPRGRRTACASRGPRRSRTRGPGAPGATQQTPFLLPDAGYAPAARRNASMVRATSSSVVPALLTAIRSTARSRQREPARPRGAVGEHPVDHRQGALVAAEGHAHLGEHDVVEHLGARDLRHRLGEGACVPAHPVDHLGDARRGPSARSAAHTGTPRARRDISGTRSIGSPAASGMK